MIYFEIFCKYKHFDQGGIGLWEEAEAEAAAAMEAEAVIFIMVPAAGAAAAVQETDAAMEDIPAEEAMAEGIAALITEAAPMARPLAGGRQPYTEVPFPMCF